MTTVSVIGCGYLGAVHAAAMVELGHTVIGIEVDGSRSKALAGGTAPFFEPGLDELLSVGLATGRLRFTDDPTEARGATLHFVCVGTPQRAGHHQADLSYLEAAIEQLLPLLQHGDVVVGKSTVPVGTAAGIAARIRAAQPGASLVWNPEFLREGFAIEDTLRPDRLVFGLGADEQSRAAGDALAAAYGRIVEDTPLVVTNYETAELAKTASNAFLATKISFINAMAELCDVAGGDVADLADIMGHDTRIGRRSLNAGLGFGGGCLPKDIRAFLARAAELGADEPLMFLREVDRINLSRRDKVVSLAEELLGADVARRRVAVLGAAFKPDSDDIRDSPALAVAAALHVRGAQVVVTDPHALDNARRLSPQLTYTAEVEDAVADAELVLLLTEWREYVALDPAAIGALVSARRIVDGRNALDADTWSAAGWDYRCLGRPLAGR